MTSGVTHKRRAKTPSFSSILLDSIYRSIDDDTNMDTTTNATSTTSSHYYYDHQSISSSSSTTTTTTTPSNTSATTLPKTYNTSNRYSSDKEYTLASKQRRNKMRSDSNGTLESAAVNLRHAIMIDSWMEHHQQPQHDHHNNHHHRNIRQKSAPTKPTTNPPKSRSSSTLSSLSSDSCFRFDNARDSHAPSSARELSSSRQSKSRDMLKKPKKETTATHNTNQQPVSPGARIAAFLNSLFRNGSSTMQTLSPSSTKREKVVLPPIVTTSSASTSTSTCSSASSFSRSCLSKTPSSRANSITNNSKSKRSVRFYPVSVIVDEDLRPCGEKYLLREENEEVTKVPMIREGNKWKREKEIDKLMKMIKSNYNNDEPNDDDSDDEEMKDENESCASSDLFELDNLSGGGGDVVGVSRFSEELPVYATTSLHHLSY